MNAAHVFSSNPIDRAQSARRDSAWLDEQRRHPGGRYLPFRKLSPAIRRTEAPQLGWLEPGQADHLPGLDQAVLLGLQDGAPHYAFPVGEATDDGADAMEFVDARTIGALLPSADAGILAQARSMLDWHARNRFCSACGSPLESGEGGARRGCAGCGARYYPQVSPSIIVLIERDGRCLLARRAGTNTNRHSCLAGYVEPGESLEEAVAREVMEESSVSVTDVRYHSSQPWPFPATLMVGCTARATTDAISVDGVELASAGWFSRDEVRAALAGTNPDLSVPDAVAIAHHLIRDWVEAEA